MGFLLSQKARLFALVCVLGLLAVAVAPAAFAAPASTTVGACGPIDHGHDVIAPPAVDMWKAPRDASGQHELILAVHRDGERFCYTYRWH
ncbi:MAG TPA: hypothetical protein VF292_11415, partial [Rhodanobacteraceae bacterium]